MNEIQLKPKFKANMNPIQIKFEINSIHDQLPYLSQNKAILIKIERK